MLHLPRVCSDHYPILIDLMRNRHSCFPKPFRFEAMWLMHDGFEALIHPNWATNGTVHASLSHMSTVLATWNREVFGDLLHAKHRLLARNDEIQKI